MGQPQADWEVISQAHLAAALFYVKSLPDWVAEQALRVPSGRHGYSVGVSIYC